MIPRRVAAAGVAALLAPVVLTGCTLLSGQSTDVPDSGPVAYYPNPAAGPGDPLTGTLEVTDACLLVQTDSATTLPVFPVGEAEWDGSVLRYDGKEYAAGDDVSLAGGVVEEGYFGPVTYIPAGCDRGETFFVQPLAAKGRR